MAKQKQEISTKVATGFDPSKCEVRPLTVPAFKLTVDQPRFFKVLEPMVVSTAKQAEPKKGEQKRAPATVTKAVDLETGEVGTLICATVIKSTFTEQYPGEGYVGKSFRIVKLAKPEGRNYYKYSIGEITN